MTAPRETSGAAPARCSGPSRASTHAGHVRALEAERARPDAGERVAGAPLPPAVVTDSLQTLIGLLASLFRKEHA